MGVKASALPPAYAEGQQVYDFSVDLAGALRMTGGGGGTSNQGTPTTLANAWPTKVTDGVDVLLVNADGSIDVGVVDKDARLIGRAKLLDSTGAVIDPALKGQLPASLGQKVMAGSLAVVMASDQSAIGIGDAGGSLTVDAPVGTPAFVRLSDGAAALIGQKLMATSLPVVIASDQSAVPVSALVGAPVFTRVSDGAAALIGQKVMASSLPVVLSSDQAAIPVNGDVDHDAVNTLKNLQIAGHASPGDVPPTAVSANADRVRAHFDRYGAIIVRRRKIRETYTAVCRLAEAAARLDQAFTQVANTNKQWATLHHIVTATKEVRLQKCVMYLTSDTVAGVQGVFELRQISAAPATGNPAITPTPHRRGGTAAEAICLYLPTTAGTEAAVNSPLAHVPFDTGISGAVSQVNPVPILVPVVLYDASQEDHEMMQPVLPVGTLDGWAAVVRTVGVPILRITVVFKFTEEIP